MAETKKKITVNLQVKEIVFDVQNKAYLTGHSREADQKKNYQAASDMQASDDVENSYQIRRSIATAFSSVKSLLGEYLSSDKTTSDNKIAKEIDSDGVLSLEFLLPSNYNQASADSLGNNLHAYLVDMALSDWFAITDPEDAQTYIQHSAICLENARRALYKRSRPTRPTYTEAGA